MEAVATEQSAPERNVTFIPEDDMRQESVWSLDLEKVLYLSLRPGRVDVTQHDRLERCVPQPLMRIAMLRRSYVRIRRLQPVGVAGAEVRLEEGENALFKVLPGQTMDS